MLAYALLVALNLTAEERLPNPLSSGVFVEWTGSDSGGSFSFRTAAQSTFECAFTGRTYFEKEHRRTRVSLIPAGEPVEVLSERLANPPSCRALIVRVGQQAHPQGAGTFRKPWATPTEAFAPRGNMLLAGVVVRVDQPYIWLRTRDGKSHVIVIRPDTRISAEGTIVGRDAIPFNRPVFVRAGRSMDGDIEAYTMVWGDILLPKARQF